MEFNSSRHPDHLYICITLPISVSFRYYKQPLGEHNYYTLLQLKIQLQYNTMQIQLQNE